ncbi:WXG100 family type VII secretion target [Microbacterium lacticum]
MANMNVTYGEMTSRADQFIAGRDEINTTLQRLQSQINALVAQGFVTDRSSGAYQEAYNRFTSGATNTIGGLEDLAAFLRTTAQTLQEVDTQIASRIGR